MTEPTFTSISTPRLLLRALNPGDAASLHARRNDPEAARHQNWALPYPIERAEQLVASVVDMGGPTNDEWYMIGIVDTALDEMVGDLALHLSWGGRAAEIGYTLGSAYWGRGYATEAVEALIGYLFEEIGVTRIGAMLHPDNIASARVLERCGFVYEGHTRLSYWVGDENSDDFLYGLIRTDWDAWRYRPKDPPSTVRLVEIDASNSRAVWRLKTHKSQERFVASMPASFAHALFPEVVDGAPLVPWMRAVEADGELVGFVMVAAQTTHHPEPYLWRLLIDRLHQRRGVGTRVLELITEEFRTMGNSTLLTSWAPGRGSPEPFYLRNGFDRTGRLIDGEIEARKTLD